MTCEFLSLIYAGRIGAGAQGTGVSGNGAGTVRFLQSGKVPALDGTGGSFTLAGADNVHFFAGGEDVGLQNVTHVQGADVVQTELFEHFLRRDVGFFEVTCVGFVGSGNFLVVEAELHGVVAVAVNGFLLNDCARAKFHNGDGNDVSLVVEDLRHAEFSADKTFFHSGVPPLVIGWPFANVTFW